MPANFKPEERQDVYTRVTNKIVADLEKGVRPWVKPWNAGNTEGRIMKPLRSNAAPYKGINVLLLWAEAVTKGYESPFWITYRQATEWNAHVRKGEKSALVVYANSVQKTEKNEATGEEQERSIPFLKGYAVFNAEQIEGLPAIFLAKPEPKFTSQVERVHHAESFFRNTGATIRERGGQAFYSQDGDYIQVPPIEAFKEPQSFYETLSHETVHWTKHPSRLAREFGRKSWGDEGYAQEELVAEIGAAYLAADLEIRPEPPEENAAYVASWLKVLKNDNRAIFSAASHAQRAADYLHGLQPAPVKDVGYAGGYIVLSAEGLAARHAPVSSADEASATWRKFVEDNCLGASDLAGDAGFIYANDGKLVAKVSYNGRVWAAGGELLQEPELPDLS